VANLLRDARFGFRLLLKNPGFAAVAVAALALGIAANTVMFSVIYPTYFEPLPYRDADRLVMVWSRLQGERIPVSPGDFRDWKRQATVFEDLNAWNGVEVNLATGDRPELALAGLATPGFLTMFGYGQPLALGRNFLEEEGISGRDQVAIVTHRMWQERFGGDPGVIGRTIRIDGRPHSVVGVLRPGPADHNMVQLWVPFAFTAERLDRAARWMYVMGRLKPGVTLEQANAEMAIVTGSLTVVYPASNTGWTASVEPFRNNFVRHETLAALWLLMGAVAFVLLIACANVANLLLARGTARQRELALRASLGASRAVILCQLVTESVVLALAGGAVGVAIAYALVHVITTLMPPFTLPTEVFVRLNVPVLLFTAAASALSAILFGCVPAWTAARLDLVEALKDSARSVGTGHHRLRRALVAFEFALALALLTGGGLALQTFFRMTHRELGLRTERLLTFLVPVGEGRLTSADRIEAFYRELLDRVAAVPGVLSTSVSIGVPLRGDVDQAPFSIPGRRVAEASALPQASINLVSPDYFQTLGIRIIRGRTFTDKDRRGGLPVAMVNETFVKRYLPDVDPLTERVVIEADVPTTPERESDIQWQIVGVYADVRNADTGESRPEIHLPFWQFPFARASVAVRTAGDPSSVQQGISGALRAMDPDLPMGHVKTMEQIVSERMANERFNTVLFGSLAAVALLLAAVGIYGVMSFTVAQRTREIGVRMALGAGRGRVLVDVLREGMATALVGAVLGSAGAYFVGRAMQSMLYGVGPVNRMVLAVVVCTLLGTALLACLVPARRAASIDPMVALRQE
jgi:putative ABC transport system permease protein